MTRQRENRDRVQGIPIWQRENGIWYADFRTHRHGSRESLGTKDRTEAEEELAERKRELEEAAEKDLRSAPDPPLREFFQRYLDRRTNEVAESTWKNQERALGLLTSWVQQQLGRKPNLSDVRLSLLRDFKASQLERVKASTFNVRLTAISQALQAAFEEGLVRRNEAKRLSRANENATEEVWLENGEAARVIEAAKAMEGDPHSRCYRNLQELIATYLLTGGRRAEVFGLTREDIDLDHNEVVFRPNDWRGLKTRHSDRRVPLWSQLKEILRPYLRDRSDDSSLLFPARDGGMLTTLRWSLATLEERADLEKDLTIKVFRHTYTAARLQTIDHGEPVSIYTVARELGHTGIERIRRTYGHLQKRRSRLEEVRYEEADVVSLEDHRAAVNQSTT